MGDFKHESTKEFYELHLKLVFEKEGFFPTDFKEALRSMYLAFEDYPLRGSSE